MKKVFTINPSSHDSLRRPGKGKHLLLTSLLTITMLSTTAMSAMATPIKSGPSVDWESTYQRPNGGPRNSGDETHPCIQQTDDGGYIIASSTLSATKDADGDPQNDVYLLKTDAHGNEVWKQLYNTPEYDVAMSVRQTTKDGRPDSPVDGYIITGYTYVNSDVYNQLFLLRTDLQGTQKWIKYFGSEDGLIYDDRGYAVTQSSDGGFLAVGFSNCGPNGDRQVYAVRTDANGELLWEKYYGGPQDDEVFSVSNTEDNGFILGGYTSSFGTGRKDAYLIKLNASGKEEWQEKAFGESEDEILYDVKQTSDLGYIATGTTASPELQSDNWKTYLLKVTAKGDQEWQKAVSQGSYDEGRAVVQTDDGGYVVIGTSYNVNNSGIYTPMFVKTDAAGTPIWETDYSTKGSYYIFSGQQTEDGGFIAAGYPDGYERKIYVVKLKGGETASVESLDLTGAGIEDGKVKLNVGDTLKLTATAEYDDSSNVDVTSSPACRWDSSDARVVTVDKGNVKAVAAGTAKVTATFGGKTKTITVTVAGDHKVSKLKLTPTSKTIKVGDTCRLTVTATYTDKSTENVSEQASWLVKTGNAVIVDKGLVTGETKGKATITATFGGKTVTAKITVK
ncbi:hypothetical protein GJ688_12970 [Heliobacillus mobilis]|uniref:BIG2 domain-containing protein n=1 Tax=Heliobacterium mobile TaxID=28064 RepID=A0A6I3SMC8_HELMO|nr:Ig-like domain-containing protein [Heliobacterium mobile]MTV49885.1 hypothetical protein [Heliobacterium mobile]